MSLEDVELRQVAPLSPLNRTLIRDGDYIEESVETPQGIFKVLVRGDRRHQAIVTFHDLGLNCISNFQAFFNYAGMREIADRFCVYHVNAPFQEENAPLLESGASYPSLSELAEGLNEVLNGLKVVRYTGIGVGLGGNVLLRHALHYPERVDSLMVINTMCTAPGWIEWGYQKRNINQLRTHGVTQPVVDYLLWHHFGYDCRARVHDLANVYCHYFQHDLHPCNLAALVEQFIWRDAINIDREHSINQSGDTKTIKVPVLNVVGSRSPFLDESVTLNSKLNPANSSWLKIDNAAMVLEERPEKVTEAFLLFLQGQGLCLNIRRPPANTM